HAVRRYELYPNPLNKVDYPMKKEIPKEKEIWSIKEFYKFISLVDENDIKFITALYLLYFTGIRQQELHGLQWADWKNNVLSINKVYTRLPKTKNYELRPTKTVNSIRNLVIPEALIKQLNKYKATLYDVKDDDFIIPWEKDYINRKTKPICEKHNFKRITGHGFRHSHASLLISENIDVLSTSKQLGHSRPSITLDTYAHEFDLQQNQIANILNQQIEKSKK
ncbi:MAG: site-specific integrase, partial [Saccharofermentanales bacterium]